MPPYMVGFLQPGSIDTLVQLEKKNRVLYDTEHLHASRIITNDYSILFSI